MSNFITPIQPIGSIELGKTNPVSTINESGSAFDSIMQAAVKNIEQVQALSASDGVNLALGDVNDIAAVQINTLKAESMIQTTVQLTSRVVNAYKEIMQMQV